MSLTAAELVIGNRALALIGQKAIDSTDTTTKDTGTGGNPYAQLDLIFDQTRDSLIRKYEWGFAKSRLALAAEWATSTVYTTDQYVWDEDEELLWKCNTAHTSVSWNTDYVLDGDDYVMDGDDYVRDDSVTFYWDLVTDRPETVWSYRYALPSDYSRFKPEYLRDNELWFTLEGGYLLTDEQELDIEYIAKITDTTIFDDLFTELLIYDLAIKLITPLAGMGYPVIADRKTLKDERKDLAKKANAIEKTETNQTGYYALANARYNL